MFEIDWIVFGDGGIDLCNLAEILDNVWFRYLCLQTERQSVLMWCLIA